MPRSRRLLVAYAVACVMGVVLQPGKTAATFNGFTIAPAYSTAPIPVAEVFGQFNSDQYMDLAVVSSGEGEISIFLGNGNGTFQTPNCSKKPGLCPIVSTNPTSQHPVSIV